MARWLLLLVLGFLHVAAVHAATLVVYSGGQGMYPGIQPAIDATLPGDTVLVMPGTYTGPLNRDLDFLGKDICVRGSGGPDSVVIDCEYSGRGFNLHSGESRSARIQGFHITKAGSPSRLPGGGIRCDSSSPTIDDLLIDHCEATYAGISIAYGSPAVSGVTIQSCFAGAAGGGMGIFSSDSTIIWDCSIVGNFSGGNGGGITVAHSSLTLENTVLSQYQSFSGGAFYTWDSIITITDCTFHGNQAQHGAGIYEAESSLFIQNCTFSANYAEVRGAALHFKESLDIIVEDSDFFGNNAASGAIIQLTYSSAPILRRLSIVDNNHGTAIGAGCCYVSGTVESCLIAFNRGGYGIQESTSSLSWLTLSCNNVFENEYGNYWEEDHTGQNGNISLDPLFCDPTFASLALAEESPCLPANNDCGILMGNHGAECTLTEVDTTPPTNLALTAHPNPFNPNCKLAFTLPRTGHVSLKVFDVSGKEVATLIDAVHPGGRREFTWSAGGLPSGVYLARLEAGEFRATEHLILLK